MLLEPIKTLRYIWSHPLAGRQRFRAISRYIRWQLGSRLIQAPVICPFVHDSVLVVERSMTGATGSVYCGLHEFREMAFLLHMLRPEDTFLDLGANIGSYSILASAVVGAQSIAVEPVLKTFRQLQRNVWVNEIDSRVDAIRCAVGRAPGTARFSLDLGAGNHVVDAEYTGDSEIVSVKTADTLLAEREPVLWKIDVEGFEFEVLCGAEKSLRNSRLLAVQIENDSQEIRKTMLAAGFVLANYDPFSRVLCESDTPTAPNGYWNNYLWIRSIAEVRARCESARRFTVLNSQF